MDPIEHRVAVGGSIAICCERFGDPADPPLVLIMGLGRQLIAWPRALCEQLAARGFHVVRFDNRDIGRSTCFPEFGAPDIFAMMAKARAGERQAAPYSLEDMAADAAGLLDALGIECAHLVGASMGGMIAQFVAINHPARTKSLVSIMSTTGRAGLPPPEGNAMRALTALPKSPAREDRLMTALAAVKAIGGPGFAASDEERRAYLLRSIDYAPFDPAAAARHLAAIIAAPPREDKLRALTIPALVIHGADDPIMPAQHGEDTARRIPGAELLLVPGLGHDFTEAAARLYLKAIGDFVAKAEARDAA